MRAAVAHRRAVCRIRADPPATRSPLPRRLPHSRRPSRHPFSAARPTRRASGLLTFAYLTVGLHFANVRMKEQVGLKEKRSRPELLLLLAVLLGMVGATLALFAEEELWLRLAFVTPSRGQPPAQQTILRVVWCVVVTDLVARYLSMAAKAALALCLCATPPRRLRQLYRLSEMCAAVYRSALPVPAWYGWLLLDGSGSLFPSLVTGLYLTFKMAAVLDQLRTLSSACRAALTHQSVRAAAPGARPRPLSQPLTSPPADRAARPRFAPCAAVRPLRDGERGGRGGQRRELLDLPRRDERARRAELQARLLRGVRLRVARARAHVPPLPRRGQQRAELPERRHRPAHVPDLLIALTRAPYVYNTRLV